MTEFTKGKWSYSMYMKRGNITLIRLEAEDKKLGILSGLQEENEANARLIAAAPEIYTFIKKMHIFAHYYLDSRFSNIFKESGEILARIDAKENGHD